LTDIGLKGKAAMRNIWQRSDLGIHKKRFKQTVNAHGVLLLRASPI
jgi:hypothetical protein